MFATTADPFVIHNVTHGRVHRAPTGTGCYATATFDSAEQAEDWLTGSLLPLIERCNPGKPKCVYEVGPLSRYRA